MRGALRRNNIDMALYISGARRDAAGIKDLRRPRRAGTTAARQRCAAVIGGALRGNTPAGFSSRPPIAGTERTFRKGLPIDLGVTDLIRSRPFRPPAQNISAEKPGVSWQKWFAGGLIERFCNTVFHGIRDSRSSPE